MLALSRVAPALLRAAHPEPAATVTVVAGLLAVALGHPVGSAALVTATVGASQLAVGWSNDALDADRDAAVGRTDKPVVTGAVRRATVAVAAGTAAVVTVLLALASGAGPAAVAGLGLASALAYNWPLKLTVFSVLPYAVSFAALPAFVVLAAGAVPPLWLLLAGGLLGAGAHFANALPDLAADAATGVRGLPHRLGDTGSALAATGLLLAATVVLVAVLPRWVGLAALVAAAVVLLAGWYRRQRWLFRSFLVVAVVDVALLVAGGLVL